MGNTMRILAEGEAPYLAVDPDGFRAFVRDHKQRALKPKLMSAHDAISRFVADGDYFVFDCNYFQRGPSTLVREVIRQGKRDLWLCGKFSYVDVGLLVGAGCVSRIDCGFFWPGATIDRAVADGRVRVFEYSNVVMTLRLQAGAMGLPFLPVRSFGGTDGFRHSGAKLVEDPFTGQPITLAPALNPDVAIIHVQQADVYGNARVFGTGIAHQESALASKKVIVSAEEIIDTEEIRRDPGRTSVPYYAVDAVVHAPFGAWPGNCGGYYGSDTPAVIETFAAIARDRVSEYVEKHVAPFADDAAMFDALVGQERLEKLRAAETITEGYRP
ncbi:MAG TPA: CoA-transferase [Dehalococcoidia bacterium]|nr:CoA-transferase [Dehalococcoidia bacterium]